MEYFRVNLDSEEYKQAYEETRAYLRREFRNGAKPEDIIIERESGESDNHYQGCVHAFKEESVKFKQRKFKKAMQKIGTTVQEVKAYYGNSIEI